MADNSFTGTLSVTDKIGIGIKDPIAQLHIFSSTDAASQAFLESGGALLKLSVDASGAKLGTDNAFSLSIITYGSPRMAIDAAGNVGIGTTPTIAEKLTVNGNLKATSFLGNGATLDGIVKKAGDTMTGPLTVQNTLTVSGGAITPATGNSENAGIMFPKNPGGGSGDAAWIRYYPRTGEATTLEIGTSSDSDDHIAFMASGNVGIGTNNPQAKLEVKGTVKADAFQGDGSQLTGIKPIENGTVAIAQLKATVVVEGSVSITDTARVKIQTTRANEHTFYLASVSFVSSNSGERLPFPVPYNWRFEVQPQQMPRSSGFPPFPLAGSIHFLVIEAPEIVAETLKSLGVSFTVAYKVYRLSET